MGKSLKQTKFNKRIVLAIVVLFAVIGALLLLLTQAAVGTASLSLSPTTDTRNNGDTFGVTVKLSTTDAVNTAIVDLSYDATKLDYVSIDSTGSVFPTTLQNSGGAGKVTLNYGISGSSVTGSNLKVATVNFKAKVGTGSAVIGIANTSHVYKGAAEEVWNGDITSATTKSTITLTTPDTTPPTVSITSPSNGATVQGTSWPITATASDASGISKVEFLINGTVVQTINGAGPYTYNWNTTTVADTASLPISVKAYDVAPAANNATSSITVVVKNNKPNLTVSNVTISPANPAPNQVVTVTATITNNGTAALIAGSAVATGFYVDGVLKSSPTDTTALAIGASRTAIYSWTATLGSHSIQATADSTNIIQETNENAADNNKTISVVVRKPGDANGDNAVNGADFSILNFNWGMANPTIDNGDFNDDNAVNGADFSILNFNWGT